MAKLPLDLAKFKKVSSDKHSTTLAHPDGHSIVVAHKALSPKMRAQLVEMPGQPQKFESGGNVTSDKSPGINKEAAAEFVAGFNGEVKQQIKPDNSITAPGQDPHILAQNPYMVQRAPGQGTLADRVWHAPDPDAQPQRQPVVDMEAQRPASPYAATMSQASQDEVNNMDQVPGKLVQAFADGGEVASTQQDSPDQIVADVQAAGGNTIPAPQQDPAIANQRQRYNSIVAGVPDAKGGLPNADRAASQSFGPNGEPPADFNADAWQQAQGAYQQQTADAKNAQDQADMQAIEQNKARVSAGVPQLPVKNPVAPPMPPGAQLSAPIQTQPGQSGDPFGVNTASEANEAGLGMQMSGIQEQSNAEQQQNKALAAAQGQAAIKEQQQLDQFQQNQQAIFNHHDQFMQAVQDGKIDPQHYMSSRGVGTRIMQGIGLLLGGIGQGLVGGSNPAMDYINKQIDNDIDAQKQELGKRQNLVSANLAYFNNMRQGTEMSRLMMQSVVGHQILKAAAATNNPIIAAKAKIAAGQLIQGASQGLGQMAMKKTLLGQVNQGETTPQQESHIVSMLAPPEGRQEAMKQLAEAQQAQSLKDDTLNAFDTIAKQQTLANRLGHPIQSKQIIDSTQNLILDKLTKDTSGRVTPETVKLVGGIFPGLATGKISAAQARSTLSNLLSQGMHYPALENLNITKYSRGGAQAPIPQSAPKPIK